MPSGPVFCEWTRCAMRHKGLVIHDISPQLGLQLIRWGSRQCVGDDQGLPFSDLSAALAYPDCG